MLDYKTMKFIRNDDKFREYIKNIKNTYVLYIITSLYLNDKYLLYDTKTNIIMFYNVFFPMSKEMLYEVETDIANQYHIYIQKNIKNHRCSVCDKYKDLTCMINDKKCKQKNIIYKRVPCSSDISIDLEEMKKIDKFLKEE